MRRAVGPLSLVFPLATRGVDFPRILSYCPDQAASVKRRVKRKDSTMLQKDVVVGGLYVVEAFRAALAAYRAKTGEGWRY